MRSEIQIHLVGPAQDALTLDKPVRRHLIQFVFDAWRRPHAQLLPEQQARDSIFLTHRYKLKYILRHRHGEKGGEAQKPGSWPDDLQV